MVAPIIWAGMLLATVAAGAFGLHETNQAVDAAAELASGAGQLLAAAGLLSAGVVVIYFAASRDHAHWFPLAVVLIVLSLPFFGFDVGALSGGGA